MKIQFSKKFKKQYKNVSSKVQASFDSRLELFIVDKFYPILNNHQLRGKFKKYRSINITGDWRAIYQELDNGSVVFFIMLGTHSQLYF